MRQDQPHRKKKRQEGALARRMADVSRYMTVVVGVDKDVDAFNEAKLKTAQRDVKSLQAKLQTVGAT